MLLVASSKNEGEWVLPKGGWENDETQEEAAMRETWEEGNACFFGYRSLFMDEGRRQCLLGKDERREEKAGTE